MSDSLYEVYGFGLLLLGMLGLMLHLGFTITYLVKHGVSGDIMSAEMQAATAFRAAVAVELLSRPNVLRLDLSSYTTFSLVITTAFSLFKSGLGQREGESSRNWGQSQGSAALLCGQCVLVALWLPSFPGVVAGAKVTSWLLELGLGLLVFFVVMRLPESNLFETREERVRQLKRRLRTVKKRSGKFSVSLRREVEEAEEDSRVVRTRRRWVAVVWGLFLVVAVFATGPHGRWKMAPEIRLEMFTLLAAWVGAVVGHWLLISQADFAKKDKVSVNERVLWAVVGGAMAASVVLSLIVVVQRDFGCWAWVWGPLALVAAAWGAKFLVGKMCGHQVSWEGRRRLVEILAVRRLVQHQGMLQGALAECTPQRPRVIARERRSVLRAAGATAGRRRVGNRNSPR
ncbi:hypothetical protein [Buchananella hordeovulneris]|nr:hypothetical protein [Buchananella hordeovulneris]